MNWFGVQTSQPLSTFRTFTRVAPLTFRFTIWKLGVMSGYLTGSYHKLTHRCKHGLHRSCHREWSLRTTLKQEVPASSTEPIKTWLLATKVPLRKSHVTLSSLSSSHDRLLFFPACQCQEPIKEQRWGNNVRMDQAIVLQCYSLRKKNVQLRHFLPGRAELLILPEKLAGKVMWLLYCQLSRNSI